MVEIIAVLTGLPMTILITAGAFAIGLVLALPVAFMRSSRHAILRIPGRGLIDLFRGIPPIVWLLMLYFGISLGAVRLTAVQAGVLGLGLVSAGYLAEIFRGGVLSIPRGQFEAAQALGLSGSTRFRRVVAPQALRSMLPATATYLIGLIKDSSIASTIGVAEMVFAANSVARQESSGITAFVVAAVFYILLSIPLAVLARRLETRLEKAGAR
ncbi:MAG: amino acid ABC transporter permease [Cellulomonadaceae bacterium]